MAKKFTTSSNTKKYKKKAKKYETKVDNFKDFQYGKQAAYDEIINNIVNRDPFSYDATGDALYENYKNQYTALGELAMKDTMAQTAAMTGGFGSSYSQMAGQQAFDAYMNQVTEKIPELYQLAQNTYQMETDNLNNKFSVLSTDRQTQYGEHNDKYDKLVNQRDFYTGRYDASYEKDWDEYQFNENITYQTARDAVGDKQWEKEYNLKKANSTSGKGSVDGGMNTYVPGKSVTEILSSDEYKTYFNENYKGKSIGQLSKENPQIFMSRGEEGQARATAEALKSGKITTEEAQAIYYHIGQDENAYNLADSNSTISKYVTKQTDAKKFEETDAWENTKATANKNYANSVKSQLEKGYYLDNGGWQKVEVSYDENGKITSSEYTERAKAFNKQYKDFGVQIDTNFGFTSDKKYKESAQNKTKEGALSTGDRINQFYGAYSSASSYVNDYIKGGYSYNGELARKKATELYYECDETIKQLKSDKKAFVEKYGEEAYKHYLDSLTADKKQLKTTIDYIDKKRKLVGEYRKEYADEQSARDAFDVDMNDAKYLKEYKFQTYEDYQEAFLQAQKAYNDGKGSRDDELRYLWLKDYMTRHGYKNDDVYEGYMKTADEELEKNKTDWVSSVYDYNHVFDADVLGTTIFLDDSEVKSATQIPGTHCWVTEDGYYFYKTPEEHMNFHESDLDFLAEKEDDAGSKFDDKEEIQQLRDYYSKESEFIEVNNNSDYKDTVAGVDVDEYATTFSKELNILKTQYDIIYSSDPEKDDYTLDYTFNISWIGELTDEEYIEYDIEELVNMFNGSFSDSWTHYLNKKEKKAITYYSKKIENCKDKEKRKKLISDFFSKMNNLHNTIKFVERKEQKDIDKFKDYDWFSKGVMNVLSVPANVFGGPLSFVGDTINLISGNEYNPNGTWQSLSKFGNTVRTGTSQEIDDAIDSEFWSKVATIGYDATMSSADMVLGSVTLGGTGYGIAMGMGAASSYAQDAYKRGANTTQIVFGSLLTGVAEGLFEKYSLDKIVKMSTGGTLKSIVVNTLKSAGVEGSEEFLTEIADQFIDNVVMGAKSNDAIAVRELMKKGYTRAQAESKVAYDNTMDAVWAFATGAVSGSQFGAVTNVVSNISASSKYKAIGAKISENDSLDAVIKEAKGLDSNSEAYKLALKLEQKVKEGKKVTDKQKGHLVSLAQAQLEKEYMNKASAVVDRAQIDDATKRLEEKMKEKGESTANANSIASIISKSLSGEKLSITERIKLKTNAVANEVLSEMEENKQNADWIDTLNSNIRIATKNESEKANNILTAYMGGKEKNISYENAKGERVSGQLKSIKEFYDDGSVDIELSNGDVINSVVAEIDESLNEMISVASAFEPDTANSFLNAYNENQDFYAYATGFELAYKYGYAGMSIESAMSANIYGVTDAQIKLGFNLGVADKAKEVSKSEKEIKDNKQKKQVRGKGKLINPFANTELTDKQKASVEFAQSLCEIGINVVLFKNKADSKGNIKGENGSYNPVTNTISLDIDAGLNNVNQADLDRAILRTAAHELTHFIQKWSPQQYENLKKFVIETLNKYDKQKVDKLANREIAKHKAQGHKLSYEGAVDEVVADACEMMLEDSKAIVKLASENLTLAEKIQKFITDFVEKIKKAFEGVEASSYAATEVERILGSFEQLQEMWDNALIDATHNMQKTSAQRVVGVDEFGREIDQDGDLIFELREENQSIKEQLKKHLVQLNKKAPVANATTPKKFKNIKEAKEWAFGILKKTGYQVDRQGFGKIIFDEKRINTALNYAKTPEHISALAVLPHVLKRGVQIDGHDNHKNRGYDTITIGAPVILNGIRGNMAVVVNITNHNYYKMHRIVMPDGSQFVFENEKNRAEPSGATSKVDAVTSTTDSVSTNIITNFSKNVKKSLRDSDYLKAVRNGDMETAQKMVDEVAEKWAVKSKIRDEDGKLLKVYHGTESDFTVFDKAKGRSTMDIQGMFFSPYELDAKGYGQKVRPYYLNITKPASEGLGYSALNKYKGKNYAGVKAREDLVKKGYDGVNNYDEEYIAFNSNQIKSAEPVVYDDDGNVIPLSERFNEEQDDIRYELRDNVVDTNNNVYNSVVSVNYDIFDGYKPREWKTPLKKYVLGNLAGTKIKVYDDNKNSKVIEFAKKNEKIKKENDINPHPVIGKLSQKNDRNSQLAVANAVELVEISFYDSENQEHKHQWLDENGWEFRKSYMMFPDGKIYEVTLNIGKAKDGRNILYDINKIHQVGIEKNISSKKLPSDEIPNLMDNASVSQDNSDVKSFSLRDENISNRELLSNALMSATKNQDEKNKLESYRRAVKNLNSYEQQLDEINSKLNTLYFSKGPRDNATIQTLEKQKKELEGKIAWWENSLLSLEATKPIKDFLKREKHKVKQDTERKLKEAQKSREAELKERYEQNIQEFKDKSKKRVESRKITELKAKIKKSLSDITSWAKANNKDKHIPLGLEPIVTDLVLAVDGSYVDYDAKIKDVKERIENPKKRHYDPKTKKKETEAKLLNLLDKYQSQKQKSQNALKELEEFYNEFKEESSIDHKLYDENIANAIKDVASISKPIYAMNRNELTQVYECIQMVKTVIRNQNKLFKQRKGITLSQKARALDSELKENEIKYKRYFGKWMSKLRDGKKSFDYSLLKPAYLFNMLGENAYDIYKGMREGQNVFANDLYEAKSKFQQIARETNYFSWNNPKKYFDVQLSSGKKLSLNVEELMMIYIASKREQYIDHLTKGGIVIERTQVEKGKNGKYEFVDETAHPLSFEDIGKITDMLTDEQKQYADKMQKYLGIQMGAKGNEVTEQLWGIHKFKDKTYFPIKSSENFLESANKEVNTKSIKNSGFTKDTIKGANNPVVVSSLTEVWEKHVQEMSLFHAFALSVEDANRIFNYDFWETDEITDEKRRTGSIKTSVANAFGQQANKAINRFIVDLNGGVRGDGVGFINKMVSLFKKNAVFFSLSVTAQQPSSIGRAMALVNDRYFWITTFKGRGKNTWEEVKKYAPIAKVKEMGSFDTSVGLTDREWLTHQDLSDYKGLSKVKGLWKNRDEYFSYFAQKADEITWCHIWNAVKKETADMIRLAKGAKKSTEKTKITATMSDEKRYQVLKNRVLKVAKADEEKYQKAIENNTELQDARLKKTRAKQLVKKISNEFKILGSYDNSDIELNFEFGSNNLDESINKQHGNYDLFVQMLSCFDEVVSNAIGIEMHNRNKEGYKPDATLKNVYVLSSAFENGEAIVPVKLEVKEFSDKPNRLYVAVSLESIKKDEVVTQGNTKNGVTQYARSSSDRVVSMGVLNNQSHIRTSPATTVSISELFRKINPNDVDFLKYVPEQFLNDNYIDIEKVEIGSEEFLKLAGQRFEEVIDKTQVYDSVFARSEIMRKKDFGATVTTAFMAEPLTTLNMAVEAGRDFNKIGGKKKFAKTIKALAYSAILNSLLLSLVTASRGQDKDDDETWIESYLGELMQNFLDYINPLTYVPFVRDISNVIQGYDVERPDMSIIADLVESFDVLFDTEKSVGEKISTFSNALGAFMGLPVKNFTRDVMAVVNTYFDFTDDTKTTASGVAYAIQRGFADSFFGAVAEKFGYEFDSNKYNRLVEAYVKGNKTQADRLYKEIFNKKKNETGKKDKDVKKDIQEEVVKGIKALYLSGEIKKLRAEKLLKKHCGLDEAKAKLKIKEWDSYNLDSDGDGVFDKYNLDFDNDGEVDNYSQYSELKSEVINGDISDIESEMTELEEIGVKKDTVVSNTVKAIKESYLNGKISIDQAIKLYSNFELVKVDGKYTKPSENDIHWKQKEWEYYKKNGTDEDVSDYSKYLSLDNAIEKDDMAGVKTAVDELIEFNFDTDKPYDERISSVQSTCSKKLKEMYLSGDTSKALKIMYFLRDNYGMYSGSGRKWGVYDYIENWLENND